MSILIAGDCKQDVTFLTPYLLVFRHLYERVFMMESVGLVWVVNLLLVFIIERIIGVEGENVEQLEAKFKTHVISLMVQLMVLKQQPVPLHCFSVNPFLDK